MSLKAKLEAIIYAAETPITLDHIVEYTGDASQRKTLLRQAEMILRGAELDIDEPNDMADIRRRYDAVVGTARRMEGSGPAAANG